MRPRSEMQLRFATILLAACVAAGLPARAQEGDRDGRAELYSDRARAAVDGALRWLAEHQNKDGSWNALVGFKINDGYRHQPQIQPRDGMPHLGVTALAGMAFLSGGHLPRQGKYGQVVERALQFVLRHVNEDGFITHNQTRMYSHAFSVLFLAEIYGMTGEPTLREKLDAAVEFTYRAQNKSGGWRYAPAAQDSDMSITVCQVVALREARNIGIKVPRECIDNALKYVVESAVTVGGDRGAFLYQHKDVPFNRNSFALTAAGLTTMQQAGLYSDADVRRFCERHNIRKVPRIGDCLRYMRQAYEPIWLEYHDHYFYFYGNYYAAQAMYTRGGETWRAWYTMVRDDLLS
ncbi:MAG: terpene cyclase/mutase family protein, partial [Deltaproteobacteria bacterium]